MAADPKAKSKPREAAADERTRVERAVSDRITAAGADDFAAAVGRLVRLARAKRGMTRRQLAQDSGASERYLAQIEGGQGNPSVIMLKGIAEALDVPMFELLPRSGSAYRGARPYPRSTPARAAVGASCARRADRDPRRAGSLRRPRAAHRADRPARRRQVDARTDAGRRNSACRSSSSTAWSSRTTARPFTT